MDRSVDEMKLHTKSNWATLHPKLFLEVLKSAP